MQWDRFQSETELREVITLFWRGVEVTDMDEHLVDGPRTERIAMEVAIDGTLAPARARVYVFV